MRGVWTNQQLIAEQDRVERVYRWANSQRDTFYPIATWPGLERNIFLQNPKRRSYHDRWVIFKFLFMNGLRPDLCVRWCTVKDAEGPIPWTNDTRDHIQHYQSLKEMGMRGELDRYPYWDMVTGKLWGKKDYAKREYLRKTGRDFY